MTAGVVLDSHTVYWADSEPARLSKGASQAIGDSEELWVAAHSWYELLWLVEHERIAIRLPLRSWLDGVAEEVRTANCTPAIAATAVELPSAFPTDPADRLICATAIELGLPLVTKDKSLRKLRHPGLTTIW